MSAERQIMLLRLHPPGQRVRFKATPHAGEVLAKHGVSAVAADAFMRLMPADGNEPGPLEGTVLCTLPDPAAPTIGDLEPYHYGVLVEFPKGEGWDTAIFAADDLELRPIDVGALEEELKGRVVQFTHAAGLGISFPAGASELGVIAAVAHEKSLYRLTVAVTVEGRETPLIVEADFTQCLLKVRGTKPR